MKASGLTKIQADLKENPDLCVEVEGDVFGDE